MSDVPSPSVFCAKCGAAFFTGGALERHLRTHHSPVRARRVKSRRCPVCGKQFGSEVALKMHRLAAHPAGGQAKPATAAGDGHMEQPVLRCPACGERFGSKNALRRHRRAVHEAEAVGQAADPAKSGASGPPASSATRPRRCEACGKQFPSTAALNTHEREAHPAAGHEQEATAAERARAEAQAQVEVVAGAVEALPGAPIDEIADATSLEVAVARRQVTRLLDERRVLPVPRADGVTGYRSPIHGLDVVEARLGQPVGPLPDVTPRTLTDIGELLNEAGLSVVMEDEVTLAVEGVTVSPPHAVLDDRDAVGHWFERYALDAHAAVLAGRTGECLGRLAPTLALESRVRGVAVLDGRPGVAAMIGATRATVRGGEALTGNYLADGPHWYLLREALEEICASALPIAEAQLHRWFPSSVSEETRQAAADASRRLIENRSLVFPYELRVDVDEATLVFSPLVTSGAVSERRAWWERSSAAKLEVPFRYEHAGVAYEGALRLAPAVTPVPCDWRQPSDLITLVRAWSLALEAYAELTCPAIPEARPARSAPRASASARTRGSASGSGGSRGVRSPGGGSFALPRGFAPLGETADFLDSYVAGHRRQLPLDWNHSGEAAANAARYGIRLSDHETWVEPHTRGMPQDALLHFRWTREERSVR